jgi:hypothetical protein
MCKRCLQKKVGSVQPRMHALHLAQRSNTSWFADHTRLPPERRQTWTLGSFFVAGLYMQPTLAPSRQHHAAGFLTPPGEPFLPTIRLRLNSPGKDEVSLWSADYHGEPARGKVSQTLALTHAFAAVRTVFGGSLPCHCFLQVSSEQVRESVAS